MNYLVTGGAGFIGSHIVEELVRLGHSVVVFDNLRTGHLENLATCRAAITLVEGDIRDPAALAAAMTGVDYVFHEAALVSVFESVDQPALNHEINLTGTLNVLAAAKQAGVRRLLFAASSAAYGNEPTQPKLETMRPEPESPYALAKVAGEYYLSLYAKLFGLPTVALRYFNVYGPRQDPSSVYSGVISKFVSVLKAGGTPTIFGDGLQTRDFVFVKDVVRANLLAMHSDRVGNGEIINVGSGQSTSLLDLLATLGKLLGRQVQVNFQPARAGDVRHSLADIDRARQRLDFTPQTTLADGLRQLLESA